MAFAGPRISLHALTHNIRGSAKAIRGPFKVLDQLVLPSRRPGFQFFQPFNPAVDLIQERLND